MIYSFYKVLCPFLKIIFLIKFFRKKALQQNAKGLEIVSSPYWSGSELLRVILILKI